jgi:hypothetical protein
MAVSLLTSQLVPVLLPDAGFARTTIIQVGLTTLAWLVTAYVGPQTERATLLAFVQLVKPAGAGWTALRREAGVDEGEVARENRMGLSLLGWVSGCAVIWTSLFAIGSWLYVPGDPARRGDALLLTAACAVSGVVLLQVTRRLWADRG